MQEVSWLQANDERTEMWCRICRENPILADKNSAIYTGTKNFSNPAFDKHTNSRKHQKVVQAIDNENRRSQDQKPSGPLDKWKDKLNEEQHQALSNVFLLAFHKAKH